MTLTWISALSDSSPGIVLDWYLDWYLALICIITTAAFSLKDRDFPRDHCMCVIVQVRGNRGPVI